MKQLCAALLLTAGLAPAQAVPTADVEQLWLDPAGRGSLFVGNGRTLGAAQFRVGVAAAFTHGNLRGAVDGRFTDLIQERFGFQLFGALGVLDWLELGANVPVIAAQVGDARLGLAPAGLGNPWVHAKVNLLGAREPFSLAFTLGVGVPVGTSAGQGNGGLSWAPRVQLGRVFQQWQVGAELGLLHRAEADFGLVTGTASERVGGQVSLAAMIASVNETGPRGEVSVRAFVPTTGGTAGVEGQVGFRWPLGPVEVLGSVGPGFGGQATTPSVRASAGVALANAPLTSAPCVEGRAYALTACPELDRDGDGRQNGVDRAPLAPEDRDGFQDDDGVPDPDNDGDGVLDAADGCPLVAGPAAKHGCPAKDSDGDPVGFGAEKPAGSNDTPAGRGAGSPREFNLVK